MVKSVVLLLVGWLLPLGVWAATITAAFDRNPVALGDPVVLTFTVDGVVDSEPDFTPLQRDFDIRGHSQGSSFSMKNGATRVSTQWELRLYPRNTGKLTVPSLAFGADHSPPVELEVLEQPPVATPGGIAPDVFVELEAEPRQPYVQQQTIITQRLLHLSPLQSQATLSHPVVESGKATLQQIGQTRNTTLLRNGRNYQAVERRYALLPQQSGELVLGRTQFEGVLAQPGPGSADPFGMSGKRTRRYSQPLKIQVESQPDSYTGQDWLPARSVTLNAHWQNPPQQLKAGEPVTLTLAVMADGLTAEQLPRLSIAVPAGIKAYTDQPELRNDATPDGIVGIRQEKWVIVAPASGTFTWPALGMDWWNTTTGKQERANLEPVTLQVSGDLGLGMSGTTSSATPSEVPAPGQTEKPLAESPADPAAETATDGKVWLSFAVGLLLAVLLLGFGWLVWRWRSGRPTGVLPRKPLTPGVTPGKTTVWQQLEQAALRNDPQATHDALLQWVATGLQLQPARLTTLYAQAEGNLQAEIDRLNRVLYGKQEAPWQGTDLLTALRHFKPGTGQQPTATGLAELYPEV